MIDTIQLGTPDRTALLDITDLVAGKVREREVADGLCIVYVPHTTAGVMINEGADPAVMQDVANTLEKLVPWKAAYLHGEGNSAAHIKSILVGGSVQVLVEGGRLLLGTWERIFLCEFDGPRTRKIHVKILRD
ncbi:MAG TPA: secondary thiamine-phosphate synthase enzyme YjbQ [Syntrophobacteraceae bacterium]|nr:secondary thiamine-phosphate synthase enzyme YjbQ [Syntrophobacteraceae bacterium]